MVNKKRVQRLWSEAGLKVPQRQHKSRRLVGSDENGVTKRRAQYPDHVWSYDFAMDATENGRRLKVMPVVDEYTRECVSLEGPLDHLRGCHRRPKAAVHRAGRACYLRSDNGPEFIAEGVKECLASSGVKTLYIEPGSPWENVYSESFVSRLRDELLNRELFVNLKEAQVLAGDYREHYKHSRSHGALGYLTPAEFAAREAEQLESVQRLSS